MWLTKICHSCGIISHNSDVVMGHILTKGLQAQENGL